MAFRSINDSATDKMPPATTAWSSWWLSMLDLHKLSSAGPEHEKTLLARWIEAADRQVDALVYELYGLTEEEIGIVEAGAK